MLSAVALLPQRLRSLKMVAHCLSPCCAYLISEAACAYQLLLQQSAMLGGFAKCAARPTNGRRKLCYALSRFNVPSCSWNDGTPINNGFPSSKYEAIPQNSGLGSRRSLTFTHVSTWRPAGHPTTETSRWSAHSPSPAALAGLCSKVLHACVATWVEFQQRFAFSTCSDFLSPHAQT